MQAAIGDKGGRAWRGQQDDEQQGLEQQQPATTQHAGEAEEEEDHQRETDSQEQKQGMGQQQRHETEAKAANDTQDNIEEGEKQIPARPQRAAVVGTVADRVGIDNIITALATKNTAKTGGRGRNLVNARCPTLRAKGPARRVGVVAQQAPDRETVAAIDEEDKELNEEEDEKPDATGEDLEQLSNAAVDGEQEDREPPEEPHDKEDKEDMEADMAIASLEELNRAAERQQQQHEMDSLRRERDELLIECEDEKERCLKLEAEAEENRHTVAEMKELLEKEREAHESAEARSSRITEYITSKMELNNVHPPLTRLAPPEDHTVLPPHLQFRRFMLSQRRAWSSAETQYYQQLERNNLLTRHGRHWHEGCATQQVDLQARLERSEWQNGLLMARLHKIHPPFITITSPTQDATQPLWPSLSEARDDDGEMFIPNELWEPIDPPRFRPLSPSPPPPLPSPPPPHTRQFLHHHSSHTCQPVL
ncbi:unnamed protein product [Vitrella brassicaformis CCMP3155]|uniref:Uncharacterized protein n=1 Tax=Vitrella brassicaformis (strain CCMP3155) TaxID=1169540 RepID=A0A0G4ER56_VITBC|nr:unnamed protein product [Vitrella brassicaformis CCMP3155]|eukprot:CEL99741.1 unnamed protein product [Vitrella brassicaformis CCMP3155]